MLYKRSRKRQRHTYCRISRHAAFHVKLKLTTILTQMELPFLPGRVLMKQPFSALGTKFLYQILPLRTIQVDDLHYPNLRYDLPDFLKGTLNLQTTKEPNFILGVLSKLSQDLQCVLWRFELATVQSQCSEIPSPHCPFKVDEQEAFL